MAEENKTIGKWGINTAEKERKLVEARRDAVKFCTKYYPYLFSRSPVRNIIDTLEDFTRDFLYDTEERKQTFLLTETETEWLKNIHKVED